MSEGFLKRTKLVVLVCLVLSLIPMLLVAIYARPLADDFGYSAATRAVWHSTHNIFLVLGAVGSEVARTYLDWQGSFSAIALFALQPALFSEKIYGLSTVILVGFFLWGNFSFWGSVIKDKAVRIVIAGAVLIVSMQTLPHANQGFYWWNGASYYTLFYSLMLLQWSMLFDRKKVVLPCILGFLIGGGNLVTGLLNLEVTVLLVAAVLIERMRGEGKVVDAVKRAVIFVFSLAGFIVNAAAPGNSVRAAGSVSMGAVQAIGQSFIDAYQYFNEWMNLPVVLLLLFVLPFLWAGTARNADTNGGSDDIKRSLLRRIPMFVLIILCFGLFASTFTPTEFSMSEVGPRRIQNVRYFVFIVFMVLLEKEALLRIKNAVEAPEISFSKVMTGYLVALAAGAVIFLGIYTVPKINRNSITSIAAARSFLIGESKAYAAERDEWTRILGGEEKVVSIMELENHPVPIYYAEFDIKGDPEDYRDQSMCDYYGKDEIILLRR